MANKTDTRTSEKTVVVPLKFVEETHTFASAWLADFHDYANDDFGDADEQAAREQELARIRYLADTSEALLLPPATQEQFRQWLSELTRFGHEPETEPLPAGPDESRSTGLQVKLNTEQFSCAIVAIWEPHRHGEIYTYLGATVSRQDESARKLAEGPITPQTWRRIIRDIAALEPATDPPAAHDTPTIQPT